MAPIETQTFQDHVSELRKRLLWVFIAMAISTAIGYTYRNKFIYLLQKPLGTPLYYNTPAGSFNFVFKVAFLVGLFITVPVIIYQLMMFIEPAIDKKISKLLAVKVIVASLTLGFAGMVFGYKYMIPMSLHFFNGYSSSQIKPLIFANEYLSFVTSILITFAVAFQIPMLALLINSIKPQSPSKLLHYQKYVIVGALVIALILPFTYDPISQFIVAVPIILMYYLSIIFVAIANWSKSRSHKKRSNAEGSLVIDTRDDVPDYIPHLPGEIIKPNNEPLEGI